jgi:uncharacterized protein DUF4239
MNTPIVAALASRGVIRLRSCALPIAAIWAPDENSLRRGGHVAVEEIRDDPRRFGRGRQGSICVVRADSLNQPARRLATVERKAARVGYRRFGAARYKWGNPVLSWIESQSTSVIALIIFSAAYLSAAIIFWIAILLSRRPIAKELQAVTPAILSPLGAILGILIAFLAVRVWTNLDHAQEYVGREATALRQVVILANSLPGDVKARVRKAIGDHLEAIISEEWPAMARRHVDLRPFPPHLEEAMAAILSFEPASAGEQLAQKGALEAAEDALEARRSRVGLSEVEIAPVQWAVIFVLSGLNLIVIAAIHIHARLAMAVSMFVFSTAVAMCLVLLMVYDRPFGLGGFTVPTTVYREASPD